MTDVCPWRQLQKLLGVWLCALGLGTLLAALAQGAITVFGQDVGWFGGYGGIALPPMVFAWQVGIGLVPALVQMLIGLYLFFGAAWLANRAIPGNRPYCHECGYDLSKVTREICPECGATFRREPDAESAPIVNGGRPK